MRRTAGDAVKTIQYMAGGNIDAATKEMEALHVGQTQETKVSIIEAAMFLFPLN